VRGGGGGGGGAREVAGAAAQSLSPPRAITSGLFSAPPGPPFPAGLEQEYTLFNLDKVTPLG
jgi:hypothetical protein